LGVKAWPQFIRGDCDYGNEENMKQVEARGWGYLFKLRQTKKAKELIRSLETEDRWSPAESGWEVSRIGFHPGYSKSKADR